VVVSFALTTLDSATRLLRYNLEEVGGTLRLRFMRNRYTSSLLAVVAIGFFALLKMDGEAVGLALCQLFGSTNQLLAGLALLVVSLYLIERRRFSLPYLIPMIFMMTTTLVAMASKLRSYYMGGNTTLLVIGGAISIIAVWLVIEAALAVRRYARTPPVESLDIDLPNE
jgi:carbon starvation protein